MAPAEERDSVYYEIKIQLFSSLVFLFANSAREVYCTSSVIRDFSLVGECKNSCPIVSFSPLSETELSGDCCMVLLRLRSITRDLVFWYSLELASPSKKSAFSLNNLCVSTVLLVRRYVCFAEVPELVEADAEDTLLRGRLLLSAFVSKAASTCSLCCKYLCRQSSHSKYQELP